MRLNITLMVDVVVMVCLAFPFSSISRVIHNWNMERLVEIDHETKKFLIDRLDRYINLHIDQAS